MPIGLARFDDTALGPPVGRERDQLPITVHGNPRLHLELLAIRGDADLEPCANPSVVEIRMMHPDEGQVLFAPVVHIVATGVGEVGRTLDAGPIVFQDFRLTSHTSLRAFAGKVDRHSLLQHDQHRDLAFALLQGTERFADDCTEQGLPQVGALLLQFQQHLLPGFELAPELLYPLFKSCPHQTAPFLW